jgi:ABC-type lipoprotein release transport system permease subunit
MIRRRDQVRLSVQKLGLRKKRAAFSIVSVALGVIVVVTVQSLMEGIRDVVVKTEWTEQIDKDVIKIYAQENPYEYPLSEEEAKQKSRQRFQFLTESVFAEIRKFSEVEAVDRPVMVTTVSIDVFAERPQPVTVLKGVSEPMLRRYLKPPATLAVASNAVPLVVGERNVRLRYDEKTKKLELASAAEQESWIGREVLIQLGDNYAQIPKYRYDYDKREYRALSEEEIAVRRDGMRRNFEAQYDITIFGATLPLKGRIVGLCSGSDVLVPLDIAVLCERWLSQRNQIASLRPARATEEVAYETRGRRTPRPGEFTEAVALVKEGADIEAVADRIKKMGYSVTTRKRAFETQAKMFDNSIRFVKRIGYAFGGLILGLACGLLWSTTSRIVSDSRSDIGLFRALGATRRDIRRLFLGETVLLGWLGTLAGMLAGWLLAYNISRWSVGVIRREVSMPEDVFLVPDSIFSIDWRFSAMLLAGAAVVSLLAGLWPANRAANIDPVKALKRE